jgi:mRNA interferase MazF
LALQYHPGQGNVVICDFNVGFTEPEMVKRRPAIIMCPSMESRPGLCTVVALSTTPPTYPMPYHSEITLPFFLPPPYDAKSHWVKADMINTVGFHRLNMFSLGKDITGKRRYLQTYIGDELFKEVQRCMLRAIGLAALTKSL